MGVSAPCGVRRSPREGRRLECSGFGSDRAGRVERTVGRRRNGRGAEGLRVGWTRLEAVGGGLGGLGGPWPRPSSRREEGPDKQAGRVPDMLPPSCHSLFQRHSGPTVPGDSAGPGREWGASVVQGVRCGSHAGPVWRRGSHPTCYPVLAALPEPPRDLRLGGRRAKHRPTGNTWHPGVPLPWLCLLGTLVASKR